MHNHNLILRKPAIAAGSSLPTETKMSCIMLCLSRRVGESIVIGDNITVISGRDGKICLVIHAPFELAVDRSEVRTAKLANPCGIALKLRTVAESGARDDEG
ncbi:Prophage PssSM-03, carbon storage regulator [Pseudomonas syringae pv. syringae]|nr:Prophage PssSM-03, carbon storage regulator [Pseudomonas syringae pv. syringae]